jgi:hypothetical protein
MRPHLHISGLEKLPSEPLAYTAREVADLLHAQRRHHRSRTALLWIFAMITIGLIMFAGRSFAHHMPWLNGWLPIIAQVSMAFSGISGIRAIFGKRKR